MEREDDPAGPARSRAGGLRAAVSIVVIGALGLLVAYYATASTTQHPSAAARSHATSDPTATPPTTLRFCGRSDIHGRYAGVGDGGQTHFGAAVLWNVSSTPCRLDGRPRLSATLDDGRPDRRAGLDRSQVAARIAVALPARTPPFVDGRLTPGRYVYAALAAPGWASNGDCQDAGSRLRWTAPRTFTLRIARVSVTVADVDRSATENHTLAGCEGTILLERVRLTG